MTHAGPDSADITFPRWQRVILLAAAAQCVSWGLFILAMPARSSVIYGLREPPRELFLWQGTGLVIFLYGVGYAISASNPLKHWAVILVGLLAKVLGPMGMLNSVMRDEMPSRVLILLPINDIVWWIPFGMILLQAFRLRKG